MALSYAIVTDIGTCATAVGVFAAVAQLWFNRKQARTAKYAREHGSAAPPVDYVFAGIPLGSWVNTQRTAYMRGKLSDERRSRLAHLRGWTWDARRHGRAG